MKTAQQLVAEAKLVIQEVSVEQLAGYLRHNSEPQLIDVREQAEFNQGHIQSAVNYPRGILEMQLANHPSVAASGCDPEAALAQLATQPLYLICRSGARSALAAESIQRMGFSQVYSVAGGMQAWIDAGLTIKK